MTPEDRQSKRLPDEEETLAEILASDPEKEFADRRGVSDEEWDDEGEPDEDELDDEDAEDDEYDDDSADEFDDAEDGGADQPDDGNAADAEEVDSEKLTKELSKAEKGLKNAQWFLIYLVIFLVIAWILFFKIIGITHMPTEDMKPRVDAGDLLVFFRLDKDAKFQDIIVFEKEIDGQKTLFVGRVMAAPGDTVEITENDRLIVNGNAIIESVAYSTAAPRRGDRVAYPLTLAEGQYFVLVDSREQGVDSRYFGPVSEDEILGTVITLIRRNKL